MTPVHYSAFQHEAAAVRESLKLSLERMRPNAGQQFSTLTRSLFERPTRDDEYQVAYAIRQPIDETRLLLAKNRLHNRRFEQRRNSVERAPLVRRYCAGFEIPQRKDFLTLIRGDARSRIIASFHCGDFLYGTASLFALENESRQQHVLTLNKGSDACFANLEAGFGATAATAECELLLQESDTQTLSRMLRAGDTSLLLFCDIPPGLNETCEVRFLGRPARFSIGPAILAIANGVPLLPLLNYSRASSGRILLGEQIEPVLLPSETLRLAAGRITQALVSLFESVFLQHPEQWRFLSLMPLYFSQPELPGAGRDAVV